MRDLDFISGAFFDYEIPKDLVWLKKYFDSEIQAMLLSYYMVFEDFVLFTAHTGVYADPRYLKRLLRRLRRLMTLRLKAKRDFNLELLQTIESGHYKFSSDSSKYDI